MKNFIVMYNEYLRFKSYFPYYRFVWDKFSGCWAVQEITDEEMKYGFKYIEIVKL